MSRGVRRHAYSSTAARFRPGGQICAVAHFFGHIVAGCHFGLYTSGSVEFGEASGWDSQMVAQCNSPSEGIVFETRISTARWCYVDASDCNASMARSGMLDDAFFSYETCGYEDELREEVNSAAKAAFDDFVDGIVHSVFVGADTDNDRLVSKPEFMFWCGRHQGSLRWLSNLARYVLESLSETLVIDDFAKDGSDFDIA